MTILRHVPIGSVRALFLSQEGYALDIALKWAEVLGVSVESFRHFRTPGRDRLDPKEAHKLDLPGRLASTSSVHIGRVLWLVRMTRLDLAQPLMRLQRRTTTWSVAEDESLHRLYAYTYHSRAAGLWILADILARGRRAILTWSDADHRNDPIATANSTSTGLVTIGSSLRVKAPLDWLCKTQGSTARSTAEAEATSASDVAFGLAVPIQETISQCTGQTLPIVHGVDASALIGAVEKGHSRKLAYMKRHQGVSISSLNDLYVANSDGNKMVKEPSGLMPVDQMTKPLSVELHERGMRLLGMGYFKDGPPGLEGSTFGPADAAREEESARARPQPAASPEEREEADAAAGPHRSSSSSSRRD